MEHRPWTLGKIMLILLVIASLVVSVLLSIQSVTGYVVSDIVDSQMNFWALGFLLIGVFGALLYMAKFR